MSGPLVRRIEPAEVEAAAAIEARAYHAGYTVAVTRREVTANRLARYLVVEQEGALAGVAGMWCIVDQAHVITVAVEPEQRRNGYGRLLVHGLILLARAEGMESATLEVRPGNAAAIALYRAYGFYEVGRRVAYYDNGEDALIMTTEELASPPCEARLARLDSLLRERFAGLEFRLAPGPAGEQDATRPR